MCSIDGCGKPPAMRGWCSMHYNRWYRHGDPLWEPPTCDERFETRIDRNGPIPEHCPEIGNCWVWTGSTGKGYGQFVSPVGTMAHRYAWFRENGPIPDGISVCHRCDNPRCVRVDHLWLGTPGDNNRDCWAKGRGASGGGAFNAAKTMCPLGHPYSGDNLYTAPDGRRTCRTCRRANERRRRAEKRSQ